MIKLKQIFKNYKRWSDYSFLDGNESTNHIHLVKDYLNFE